MKIRRIIVLILASALLLTAGVRAGIALRHNNLTLNMPDFYSRQYSLHRYSQPATGAVVFFTDFKYSGRDDQYAKKVLVEEIDFNAIVTTILSGMAVGSYGDVRWAPVELTMDINYYDVPNGEAVKTIPKGTTVFGNAWGFFEYYFTMPLSGYPTYDQGWRYTIPLVERGSFGVYDFWTDNHTEKYIDTNEKYYVKTSDLLKVAEELLKQNINVDYVQRRLSESGTYIPPEKYARLIVYAWDYMLYGQGIYESPDLYWEPLDTLNIALLASGGALIAGWAILAIRVGRDKKAPPGEKSE